MKLPGECIGNTKDVLKTKGKLWVVGNRHLGYHIKL